MTTPTYSLAEIMAHPGFPFADWEDNDLSFLMLELFWAERIRALLGDDLAGYRPLFDTERDGNPILSLSNPATGRGLRIVVSDNIDGKPLYPDATGPAAFYGLYAYLNNGRLPDGETPVTELVLLATPDPAFASDIDLLVHAFCRDGVPVDETEDLIAHFEQRYGMAG